ncbi:virulence factor [Candidatus Peregrinibacteria bacterium RIFOXYB2_FULL_32_7]|nr:MAG: virulence factor [Candidatus Peregrinibacteria bacterium RIFOXYB2_FULL_32_7]
MQTAKIFTNGRSQAVRLPKEFRFDDKEVYINKIENMVILIPKENKWDLMRESLSGFSEDFMQERNQPMDLQIRPSL